MFFLTIQDGWNKAPKMWREHGEIKVAMIPLRIPSISLQKMLPQCRIVVKIFGNRTCKRELVNYLSHSFLSIMPSYLKGKQKFIAAGGFDNPNQRDKAFVSSSDSLFQNILPAEVPSLQSDHEETDSRVWLHALDGQITSVLIVSADTDTYHIGLPLLGKIPPKVLLFNCQMLQTKKSISILMR